MKRQRVLRMIVLVVVVAAVLAACAPKPTATPVAKPAEPTKAAPEPAAPVELTIWTVTYQPFVDGMTALTEKFRETHPEVTFNIEMFAWSEFWTKITAAVAAGEGPDIPHLYTSNQYRLVAEGVLLPLDPADFELDKMAPMVKQSLVGNKLWAVPMGLRTFAYVYNPDLYAAAGVDAPPTTWEEEITIGEKLSQFDADGNFTVVGEGVWPKWEGWTIWQVRCVQFGGSYISDDLRTMTWDCDGCVEAFKFMTSKLTDHKIFVDGFHESWSTAFADGVEAGFFGPSGVVGALRGQQQPWKVAQFPAGPASDVTLGNYWPLGITQQVKDDSAKLDAALEFVKFVATPEGNRIWCRLTGDVPAFLEVAAEDEFAEADYGGFVEAAANTVFIFDPDSLPTRAGWETAWDKVVLEGADPETALIEGMAQAQDVLDDFWSKMDAMGY